MNRVISGKIALIMATVFWGLSFVVLKNSLDVFPVFMIISIRFFIAGIIFLLISLLLKKVFIRNEIRYGIILGIFIAFAYIFQTWGLMYTTPGKNAFLTAIYCLLIPFLSVVLLGTKLNKVNILAIIAGTVGVGFVCLESGINNINIGDILTLICSIFYALLVIYMSKCANSCDLLHLTSVEFLTASFICVIPSLLFESFPNNISMSQIVPLLYLIFICTGLCFFLQLYGLKYTKPTDSAIILTLESVFGALCSIVFYGERPTIFVYIGFLLVFGSVVFNEFYSAKYGY